jgi:hypothetical protein
VDAGEGAVGRVGRKPDAESDGGDVGQSAGVIDECQRLQVVLETSIEL